MPDVELSYTVANTSADEFAAVATVGGKEVAVKIPGVSIEMVSEDGSMGHTFRLAGDTEEMLEDFTPGTVVTVTLSPGDAAPVATPAPTPAATPTPSGN